MPPLVCPQPGPRHSGPDCPLFDQRALTPDQQLRRAILRDQGRSRYRDMAELVWADANVGGPHRQVPSPINESRHPVPNPAPPPPTRPELPAPESVIAPVFNPAKGANHD